MALLLQLLAQQHAHGHGCREVSLCGSNSLRLVLPQRFLVAQGTEGDDGNIHVAVCKRGVDDGRMGVEVRGVEVDNLDLCALGLELCAGRVDTRGILARGERDVRGAAVGEELGDDAQTDLGGTAQKQDVLCLAYCIQHVLFRSFRGGF